MWRNSLGFLQTRKYIANPELTVHGVVHRGLDLIPVWDLSVFGNRKIQKMAKKNASTIRLLILTLLH